MSYAIIRNAKYKRENLKGIYRHNERKNKNYSNKNVNEEELVKIVKRSNDYEKFLKKTYLEISKYVRLDKIDWIIEGH